MDTFCRFTALLHSYYCIPVNILPHPALLQYLHIQRCIPSYYCIPAGKNREKRMQLFCHYKATSLNPKPQSLVPQDWVVERATALAP